MMMTSEVRQRPRRDHDRSVKLEAHENDRLIALIQDSNGLSMATSIIQMYRTVNSNDEEDPNNSSSSSSWSKYAAGVICLVKDYTRRSYYFRLFTLRPSLIWEEELCSQMDFKKSTDHFYYYTSTLSNNLIGFNFACTKEALKFRHAVIRALNSLYRLEYKLQQQQQQQCQQVDSNNNNCVGDAVKDDESSLVILQDSMTTLNKEVSGVGGTASNNTSFKKQVQNVGKFIKMKLTRKTSSVAAANTKKSTSFTGQSSSGLVNKSDISDPRDFVHVNHIGLSTTGEGRGLDVQVGEDGKDIELIVKILKHLNIKPNPKSVQYAKDFMQTHGGWEKYYDEVKQQQQQQHQVNSNNMMMMMTRSKTVDCNLKLTSPMLMDDFKQQPITPTFTITTANNSSSTSNNDSNNSSTPMVARVYSEHHNNQLDGEMAAAPISPPPRRITSAQHKPLPPPRPPPAARLESTNLMINSPTTTTTNLSFISPIAPNNRQLDEEISPVSAVSNNNISTATSVSSAMMLSSPTNSLLDESKTAQSHHHQPHQHQQRSALLKSIEAFQQGGLKHVETNDKSLLSSSGCGGSYLASPNTSSVRFNELSINQNSSQNKLMSQLVQALSQIRPYINYFSDSDQEESDQSSTFSSDDFY